MVKTKKEIRKDLIVKAREMLVEKGLDYLTARKLADYSGYSIGTIYNQFNSMDNIIQVVNAQTLKELYQYLSQIQLTSDAYINLNRFLTGFIEFIANNKNLWFTLYDFHFRNISKEFSFLYMKQAARILRLLENNLHKLFVNVPSDERNISTEVLFITIFTVSSLLTKDKEFSKLEKEYVVKILFNTYLAGFSHLVKR